MYFYLLIKILLHLATNDVESKSLKDLEGYFKKIYRSDDPEYIVLEEFIRNYDPNRVIWWYTRPTFLYETLNTALRNSDFDTLFALQLFIGDLYIQLSLEHDFFLHRCPPTNVPILCVFRGQAISVNDVHFMKRSIGDFLLMQSFLSTTTSPDLAIGFARATRDPTDDITRIVFQFNIDTRLTKTRPYANIKNFSYFHDEDEVLIMVGAIFRIEQVQFNKEQQMWNAILKLCSDDEYELKELLSKIETEVGNRIDSLGWLLYREGQYDRAKQHFEQMLKDPSISDLVKASCYYGLSGISLQLRDVDEALKYATKNLDIVIKLNDALQIAVARRAVGEVYYHKKEYNLALTYLQQALDVFLPSNNSQLGEVYRTMANIYREKNDFTLALETYEKVLATYKQQHLPLNHENYGITYTNLAKLYEKNNDHEKQLELYIKAREILLKSLPPSHPDLLDLENIINYLKKKLQEK
jgi:tetratricopeptide (TPR) repeat protein